MTLLFKRYFLTSVTVALALACFLCGCVHRLRQYNEPSQQKVRVESPTQQKYIVRVADKSDYPVPPDGRVLINVPRLDRGCAKYLFGVIKVSESSPYDMPALDIRKNTRSVRTLSLNDLEKLPLDNQGYRVIRLE